MVSIDTLVSTARREHPRSKHLSQQFRRTNTNVQLRTLLEQCILALWSTAKKATPSSTNSVIARKKEKKQCHTLQSEKKIQATSTFITKTMAPANRSF